MSLFCRFRAGVGCGKGRAPRTDLCPDDLVGHPSQNPAPATHWTACANTASHKTNWPCRRAGRRSPAVLSDRRHLFGASNSALSGNWANNNQPSGPSVFQRRHHRRPPRPSPAVATRLATWSSEIRSREQSVRTILFDRADPTTGSSTTTAAPPARLDLQLGGAEPVGGGRPSLLRRPPTGVAADRAR